MVTGICLFLVNISFAFFSLQTVADDPDTNAAVSQLRGTTLPTHRHAIPNVLIFTHHINLLTETFSFSSNNSKDQPLSPEQTELLALQANVHNVIALHPTATVRFLTDADCIDSIRRMYQHNTTLANEFVDYFTREPTGMFKADLCRGVALYETGGLYIDVDLGVRLPLFTVLRTTTQFATVRVHRQSKHPGAFFQAFTAATPGHAVIRRYVELFLDHYQSQRTIDGPLGVMFLKQAFDAVAPPNATVELWHEALYNPDIQDTILKDVPPPTWGYRRACKFIVITEPKIPVIVPFYSRIAGSRMCPVNTDAQNRTKES